MFISKIISRQNCQNSVVLRRIIVGALAIIALAIGFFTSMIRAEQLENDVEVEPATELTYYLKVKYDGVDRNGTVSSDAQIASVSSNRIKVTDKIPDGLTFKGFITTEDSTIGATLRSDSATSCPGWVVDDTKEESVTEGSWNADNTEFTYHGLHYDTINRTVSFYVERLKAGCELTVGIVTETPATIDDPDTEAVETRRDFYNTALAVEGIISAPSNTVHAFMGNKKIARYNVVYSYTGDVPENAPDLPTTNQYAENASVGVATAPSLEGYTFSGWTTENAAISDGSFIMPANDVTLTGIFVQDTTQTKYSVTYQIDNVQPEDFVAPNTKTYKAGTEVVLDSTDKNTEIDGYKFMGWTSSDVELSKSGFTMPAQDVVIIGTFERIGYEVSYRFQGTTLPSNANELLPATETYYPGDTVTVADNPTASGYRFLGWYKDATFTMPSENVVILGEWGVQAGSFNPTLTKTIVDAKESYMYGNTVRFKITITNTASYEIHDVVIQEQLEGAKFVSGTGYTVDSDYIAEIASMAAGASVDLYSEYAVTDNVEQSYTNSVEIIGALADGNNNLDNTVNHTAIVDFQTVLYEEPPVITGVNILNVAVFVGLVGLTTVGGGIVVFNRKR